MEDFPKVGDVWVSEDNDGNPVTRKVTAVLPPDRPWNEHRISLDNSHLAHLGWWYGQGWEPQEEEEESTNDAAQY